MMITFHIPYICVPLYISTLQPLDYPDPPPPGRKKGPVPPLSMSISSKAAATASLLLFASIAGLCNHFLLPRVAVLDAGFATRVTSMAQSAVSALTNSVFMRLWLFSSRIPPPRSAATSMGPATLMSCSRRCLAASSERSPLQAPLVGLSYPTGALFAPVVFSACPLQTSPGLYAHHPLRRPDIQDGTFIKYALIGNCLQLQAGKFQRAHGFRSPSHVTRL